LIIARFDLFLSKILLRLGPAFVKFGQMLSTRADMVPAFIAKNLAMTQDDMPHESKKYIKKFFFENFGAYPEEIFSFFEYKAVSAASIAEVHFAISKDGKKQFAVKILRKNIRKKIKLNIIFLKNVVFFLEKRIKKLQRFRLNDIVNLLHSNLLKETDLRIEAFSALKLKINLMKNHGVYIPEIDFKLSSEKIIVMEWINAKSVSKIQNWDEFDKRIVLKNLVNSFCDQAYNDGFFHADLHPGNIMIDDSKDFKNRIILIDFGSCGFMDSQTKFFITEILRGFLTNNYELVASVHFEAGYVEPHYDIKKFELACKDLGSKLIGKNLENISIAEVFTSLLKLTSDFQMKIRPELLLIQKATVLLEAVSKKIDKSANIWALSSDWLEKNYMCLDKILFRKIKIFYSKIHIFISNLIKKT
jgi:ubiquinone biosynthesis protein